MYHTIINYDRQYAIFFCHVVTLYYTANISYIYNKVLAADGNIVDQFIVPKRNKQRQGRNKVIII
jgi:hypothetical protein